MRRMKKMAKFSLLGCLALILYGIATSSGAGWMYVISASLAGVIAVSILSTFSNTRGVEAKRHSPPVGTAGEPLACALEIRNSGKLSKTLLEIEDDFAGGKGRAVAARIKPGAPERLEYAVENPRRGVYSDGGTRIESSAPFGLLASRRILRTPSVTTIYPKTFEVAGLPRPDPSDTAESGKDEAAAPRRGAGGEFWGVRDYRPGDPARLIAWRQSARSAHTGRLAVMEMARETEPPFTISLDLDEKAPHAAREMAVSAAASLLLRALREDREATADAGPQNAPFPENPDRDALLGWCATLGNTGSGETRRSAPLGEWGVGKGKKSKHPPSKPPVKSGDSLSDGKPKVSRKRKSRASPLPGSGSDPSEAAPSVEIISSLGRIRAGERRAETVVLVSCHEFAGAGPSWMSPEEERSFMDEVEASGRRAVRLGPDVSEPWDIS